MKKYIYSFLLIALLISSAFAQGTKNAAVISAVKVQGRLLDASFSHVNFEVGVKDSVTFYYNADFAQAEASQMHFKALLDGKIADADLKGELGNFFTLKNLPEGIHEVKVSAYTLTGWESLPAVVTFTVKKTTSQQETKPDADQQEGISASSNTIIYILSGVIVLLLIVIIILLMARKRKPRFANVGVIENQKEEIKDYKYSYEKLKKEIRILDQTNSFLKIQIQELKSTVTDLEDANVQLVKQKERLQDSKRQLEELQSQKDEIFAMAVHDIKNPASIIKGLIELLTDYDLNAKEQQDIMHSLTETSARIIALAHQMATVCAKTTPEPEVNLEPASIKEIIDSVCKRNVSYANNKNVKLINNTSSTIPEVDIDKGKIDEVFDNLINNAIKYGPEETIVQVRSYFNQSNIIVEIADTGVGFSEEDLKHIFGKGVLLSSQPTGGETRSGLGLWIVKKIIEDHGGSIKVESAKGSGAKFTIELPLKAK